MAYKSISVEITQEHFERSIKGSPREAIKELIWNACDADAQSIEVTFGYTGLPGAETVSDIYVKDDGHGIPVDCIEEYFGKYGLSRKSVAEKAQQDEFITANSDRVAIKRWLPETLSIGFLCSKMKMATSIQAKSTLTQVLAWISTIAKLLEKQMQSILELSFIFTGLPMIRSAQFPK